jgi:hypothetical protein
MLIPHSFERSAHDFPEKFDQSVPCRKIHVPERATKTWTMGITSKLQGKHRSFHQSDSFCSEATRAKPRRLTIMSHQFP